MLRREENKEFNRELDYNFRGCCSGKVLVRICHLSKDLLESDKSSHMNIWGTRGKIFRQREQQIQRPETSMPGVLKEKQKGHYGYSRWSKGGDQEIKSER